MEYTFIDEAYPVEIRMFGETYPSLAHAFLAARFDKDQKTRDRIRKSSFEQAATWPQEARAWNSETKSARFKELIRRKFTSKKLFGMLEATPLQKIEELAHSSILPLVMEVREEGIRRAAQSKSELEKLITSLKALGEVDISGLELILSKDVNVVAQLLQVDPKVIPRIQEMCFSKNDLKVIVEEYQQK